MPLDILGPASDDAVTSRPARTNVRGASDTWFVDCSTPDADDGTQIPADWLNDCLAQLRTVFTEAGINQDNADDMLWRAMQSVGIRYAVDSSGTPNVLTAAFTPEVLALTTPLFLAVKANNEVTGPTTLTADGMAAKAVVRNDGFLRPLALGDWPAGRVGFLMYDGTRFLLMNSPLQLQGNPTLYVRTDGNDANDGSVNDAAHAFATIQAAITYAKNIWSLGGKILNIQLGNAGTYTGGVNDTDVDIHITGNTGSPASYVIQRTSGSTPVVYVQGATLTLSGVTVQAGANTMIPVQAAYGATININDCVIHCTVNDNPFAALVASSSAAINIAGAVTINSNFGAAFQAEVNGSITIVTTIVVTFAGGPAWSIACAYARAGGVIESNGSVSGVATGARYLVNLNGVINTFGGGANFFSGSSAGSTGTGGQYG